MTWYTSVTRVCTNCPILYKGYMCHSWTFPFTWRPQLIWEKKEGGRICEKTSIDGSLSYAVSPQAPLLTPTFSESLMGVFPMVGGGGNRLVPDSGVRKQKWPVAAGSLHSYSLLGQNVHEMYMIRERGSQVAAILSLAQSDLWQSESSPIANPCGITHCRST